MRPIDADALVDMLQSLEDKLDKKAFHDVDFRAAYISGIVQEIKNRVIEAPTLDYAPVRHGEWVGLEFDGYADGYPVYDLWECSECKGEHKGEYYTLTDYCPECGAKMDGGKKDG